MDADYPPDAEFLRETSVSSCTDLNVRLFTVL